MSKYAQLVEGVLIPAPTQVIKDGFIIKNPKESLLKELGLSIPSKVTAGDITYAANMAYADYYPDLLKDENSCIKYAHMSASDIDGYDGMIFSRWLADVMGKSIKIDWQKFI